MFLPLFPLLSYAFIAHAANFSFTYSDPRSCDDLTVSWNGGEPPYSLFITPKFSVPVNISIPSESKGEFTTNLPLNKNASFVLTMSDKSGFGTGGTSPLLTPADSGNDSCTTNTSPPFTFSLPNALQQCGQFQFNGYNGAAFPLEFIGIIPQGPAFSLITNDHNSFKWTTDVKAGQQIIWVAQDAKGRSGGTSDLLTVQLSETTSCLDGNSPSATATSTPKSNSDHTSAILGGALGGGLAGILILGGALFIWLRKRRRNNSPYKSEADAMLDPTPNVIPARVGSGNSRGSRGSRGSRMQERHHVRPMPDSDDMPSPSSPYTAGPVDGNLEPNPYVFPSTAPSETSDPQSRSQNQTHRSSKAGMSMSTPRTPRFILHTDAEDAEEEEEEVVELPPQYKPARGQPPSQPPPSPQQGPSSSQGTETQPGFVTHNQGPDFPEPQIGTSYPPGHAF